VSGAFEVRGLNVQFSDARVGAPAMAHAMTSENARRVSDADGRTGVYTDALRGLRDITFSVTASDCQAVLGVSGSGKSSLLRTLAGLQRAAAGAIRVNGRDVTTLPPEQRSIVYLHQEPVLFPHRTVVDNVAFPLQVRGIAAREAAHRALEWLSRLQVGELASRMPQQLSGGQRHRVALARALCAEPAVLLLDEPLASLDPAVRRDVGDALQAARRASGAAMVLVTHELDDALAIATHIMTLGHGRQTALDTPEALLAAPPSLAVARLLGIYAELAGEVIETAAGMMFRWAGGRLPVVGGIVTSARGPAVACVRAHEVQIQRCDASGGLIDAPLEPRLTVVDRRDGASEAWITLRDAAGANIGLRTGGGTDVRLGDSVQVTLRHARIFSPD